MPTINSINLNGISYALEGGGGNSQDIEDIKRLIYPSITTVCEEGEPITFTKGNRVITVTPTESGTYTQYIPELGTWTVEMESGGVEFSRDVEVENVGDGYSVVYPSITAESEDGVPVSFTKGDIVIEKIPDENGVVTQYLPELGTWRVNGRYNGHSINRNISISRYTSNLTLSKDIYLVESTSSLSTAREDLAAATIGDYALFFGGLRFNYTIDQSAVDAFNSSLVRSSCTNLSEGKNKLAAASNSSYALVGGGVPQSNSYSSSNSVDAYNSSLVRSSASTLSAARSNLAATSNGDKVFFCGGSGSKKVDIYDVSLIRTSPNDLTAGRSYGCVCKVGEYIAVMGGGSSEPGIEVYNSSLIKSAVNCDNLLTRMRSGCCNAGEYAVIAGGQYGASSSTDEVTAISPQLITSSLSALSYARYWLYGLTLDNKALFGGGRTGSSTAGYTTVDIYNESLVKQKSLNLTSGQSYQLTGTVLNKYAIFGGGNAGGNSTSIMSVFANFYYVSQTLKIEDTSNYKGLGKLLIPKSSGASETDDIFIGSNSTSPTVSNAKVRKSGIVKSGTVYIFIKKSLFEFSNYGDTESAENALNYLTIIAHSSTTGNSKHYSFTTGSNHTSTHYQFVLTNVASPFRIYLQN